METQNYVSTAIQAVLYVVRHPKETAVSLGILGFSIFAGCINTPAYESTSPPPKFKEEAVTYYAKLPGCKGRLTLEEIAENVEQFMGRYRQDALGLGYGPVADSDNRLLQPDSIVIHFRSVAERNAALENPVLVRAAKQVICISP